MQAFMDKDFMLQSATAQHLYHDYSSKLPIIYNMLESVDNLILGGGMAYTFIKARGGKIIAVIARGDEQVRRSADFVIEVPVIAECLMPIVVSVPLQLLAYYIAVYKGRNVDQPRNLAKSVTVE